MIVWVNKIVHCANTNTAFNCHHTNTNETQAADPEIFDRGVQTWYLFTNRYEVSEMTFPVYWVWESWVWSAWTFSIDPSLFIIHLPESGQPTGSILLFQRRILLSQGSSSDYICHKKADRQWQIDINWII
jgi:hypothetical protein